MLDGRGASQTRAGRRRARRGPSRGVTMTDVAREAGCSQSTVSFVLNDRDAGISETTREHVREVARRLGYRHRQPRSGVAGPHARVGFVIDHLSTSPEAVIAIDGVRRALAGADAVALIAQTEARAGQEARVLETLLAQPVDALIYAAIFTRQVEPPERLRRAGVPVVLLNCTTADGAFPAVVPAEVAGGRDATRRLIEAGHRRIATITGEIWMDAARDRLAGHRAAFAAAGLPCDPALVAHGDWSASAGHAATRAFLALDAPPTAIACQNDRMAIGCYEALKEAGLRIPEDVSVVGYDDEEIARHLNPALTTLVLPHRAMGEWAVERWRNPPEEGAPHPVVQLDCPLVERASVAPPAAP